jgi:hypothetical protein
MSFKSALRFTPMPASRACWFQSSSIKPAAPAACNTRGRGRWDSGTRWDSPTCPRSNRNRLKGLTSIVELDRDNRLGQVARCHNRHRGLHDGREAMAMMLYRAREDRYERLRYAGARQSSSRGLPAAGRWCCSDIFPWPTGRALLGPASDDLHQI